MNFIVIKIYIFLRLEEGVSYLYNDIKGLLFSGGGGGGEGRGAECHRQFISSNNSSETGHFSPSTPHFGIGESLNLITLHVYDQFFIVP